MTEFEIKERALFKAWLNTPTGEICKFERDIAERAWLARAKLIENESTSQVNSKD